MKFKPHSADHIQVDIINQRKGLPPTPTVAVQSSLPNIVSDDPNEEIFATADFVHFGALVDRWLVADGHGST
jgi:hypothetical protein